MPRRLEVGSGYHPYRPDDPEWEHADISPNAPHIEHQIDVFGPLPFQDETFDEVRAVDILEHTTYRRTEEVLREWHRVLRRTGRIYIQVPAADEMIRRYERDPLGMIVPEFANEPPIVSLAWRLLGGHEDGTYARDADAFQWNAHYALFDTSSLSWYLQRVGFAVESMIINPFPNIQTWATRL